MADDEDNGLKYINQIAAIHRSQRDFLNHDVTKATAFVLTSMLAAPTAIEGVSAYGPAVWSATKYKSSIQSD